MKSLALASGTLLAAALLIRAAPATSPALPSFVPFSGEVAMAAPLVLLTPELRP